MLPAVGSFWTAPAVVDTGPWSAWGPILMLLLIGIVFAVGTLTLSVLVGRSRSGPVKGAPYEAGVEPTGDARRPFNMRFYVIAMIFLLFDVETVLLVPWAVVFGGGGELGRSGLLLTEMFVFLDILLIGFLYAWRRGVLRFD